MPKNLLKSFHSGRSHQCTPTLKSLKKETSFQAIQKQFPWKFPCIKGWCASSRRFSLNSAIKLQCCAHHTAVWRAPSSFQQNYHKVHSGKQFARKLFVKSWGMVKSSSQSFEMGIWNNGSYLIAGIWARHRKTMHSGARFAFTQALLCSPPCYNTS